jgi:hypothetical protein
MGNTGVIKVFTLNFVISKISNALQKEKVVEFTPGKTKTQIFLKKLIELVEKNHCESTVGNTSYALQTGPCRTN